MRLATLAFFSARSVSSSSSALSSTNRMSFEFMFPFALPALPGFTQEREVKCRPPSDRAFRPNAAAMAMDDALYRCQTDARAFELGRLMQPLERAEQLGGVGHIESGSVVADKVDGIALLAYRAEFNMRFLQLAGKLPGIAKQVFQGDTQQPGIAAGPNIGSDFRVDDAPGLPAAPVAHDTRHNRAQMHRLTPQLAARQTRKVE